MVSKQIRNAHKSKATRSQTVWPSLHVLPQPSKGDKKPLSAMLRRAKGSEPLPEALAIVIPCRTADKPDRISPIYLVVETPGGAVESAVWQCRCCTRIFHTRKAWARHCGLGVMVNKISDACAGV